MTQLCSHTCSFRGHEDSVRHNTACWGVSTVKWPLLRHQEEGLEVRWELLLITDTNLGLINIQSGGQSCGGVGRGVWTVPSDVYCVGQSLMLGINLCTSSPRQSLAEGEECRSTSRKGQPRSVVCFLSERLRAWWAPRNPSLRTPTVLHNTGLHQRHSSISWLR
jgi:hypothetical protein